VRTAASFLITEPSHDDEIEGLAVRTNRCAVVRGRVEVHLRAVRELLHGRAGVRVDQRRELSAAGGVFEIVGGGNDAALLPADRVDA
jgi:hypothetical protein